MQRPATPDLLAAALSYAGRGIPVFPCKADKTPLTAHGFKEATTDAQQVKLWWLEHPEALIGMPTGKASGIVVLDLDKKHGKDGEAALIHHLQGEILPDTRVIKTQSGGLHLYFSHEDGFRNSADEATGIDVRAQGGYVIVPPSPGYGTLRDHAIAPAPDCLREIFLSGFKGVRRGEQARTFTAEDFGTSQAQAEQSRLEDAERALNWYWNPDSYDDWYTAAMALHTLPGGKDVWLKWAAKSDKFNLAENEHKWRQTVPSRGITVRSLFERVPRERLQQWGRESRKQATTARMFERKASSDQDDTAGPGAEETNAGTEQKEQPKIRTSSFLELLTDQTPDPADFIEPNFLGPGNFCLIAGPPKAQKSFLLTEMLVACASGTSFLSGRFTVPKPLKVFYLQAEMNRKLLKKRARMMTLMPGEQKALLAKNLIVTERFHMILNEEGVKLAIDTIRDVFPDGPDIIAIDPLANLFDGDSEDKSTEMMAFLNGRIEAIRRATNPAAAVIMVHHSAKKNVDDMNRDPFVAIRGSGALRGYYDTGVIIFRTSEEGKDRRIFIECRNGESPEPMTVRLTDRGTMEEVDPNAITTTPEDGEKIKNEIRKAWLAGNPLSNAGQTKGGKDPRHIGRFMAKQHGMDAKAVERQVDDWLTDGVLSIEVCSAKTKKKGLKVTGIN